MDTYDVYLERYKGFNILSSVVAQAKSTDDLTQIYSMALKEAKTNGNFWSYKEIYDEGARNKLKLADFDVDWFKKKEKDYEAALAKADNQLKQNLSSKIKPSIQASYVELAKLHSEAGNQKMFDECANHAYDVSKDNLNANFYYKVSRLHQRQFEQVKKIIKDQESNDSFAMSAINNKTAYTHARAIQGIMNIRDGDYILGLHAFLEVSPEVVPDLGIYSSYADVARYIVVLAIIGLNRNEIKSKILTGYPKQLLATNPVASKFIESFLNANYEEFGAGLQRIFSEWKNDRYVKEIWEDVYNNVLSAAITQYLAPIEKVKIETVANSFKIKNEQAEDIVKRLILNKAVSFRIDRLNRTFVAKVVNNLDQAHLIKKASNMVGNYCFEKQNAVLKVGFTALANARHKTKGGFDPTD